MNVTDPMSTGGLTYLAGVWADALNLDAVAATDDFLALNGDSLTAMRITARVRDEARRDVSVADLLESRSLDEFHVRVAAARRLPPG